jgi:colicin import membrane protein
VSRAKAEEEERRQKAEQGRIAAENARKEAEKQAREAAAAAELQRKQIEEQTRKAQEAIARAQAEKAKAEAEREKALEASRKAEEERKQAELAQRRREEKAALAAAMEAESDEQLQRDRNVFGTQIVATLQRNWIRPKGASNELKCTVLVTQLPNGEVVGVKVVKGSGNVAFDKSVERAVWNSSPLPLPADKRLFLREFSVEFIPRN